jgi:hypothetical protein
MTKDKFIDETRIANALLAIFDRLDDIEKAISTLASKQGQAVFPDAVLLERLQRLTLKRHAVLTASLAGVSYATLATLMKCDATTIKLHLKGALSGLAIPSRGMLLAKHAQLLDSISDEEYKARFGLSKTWWLEQETGLMAVLCRTKTTANQHTKGGNSDQ